jgi:uncharacterized protein (TIRG00374 family)
VAPRRFPPIPPRVRTALALVGSVALGAGLLWLALRGVDLGDLRRTLAGADWRWLMPIAVVAIASHALRAWRWTFLLDTLPDEQPDQPRPGFWLAFGSTLIGYLVNTAIPRGGEVARAGNLAARTSLGFPAVMGTVVVERVLDVLTLGLWLLTLPVLFGDRIAVIYRAAAEGIDAIVPGGTLVLLVLGAAGLVGVAAFIVLGARRRGNSAEEGRLHALLRGFREGLISLGRVHRPWALAFSTLGIWACYTLMSDLPLRMLGVTQRYGLNLIDAWGVMNVGAIGMALPAPGGTGSYHYAVVQALGLLCGVPETPAAAFALLGHGAQLVLFAVGGATALIIQGAALGRREPM